jgi:hypothetical protein
MILFDDTGANFFFLNILVKTIQIFLLSFYGWVLFFDAKMVCDAAKGSATITTVFITTIITSYPLAIPFTGDYPGTRSCLRYRPHNGLWVHHGPTFKIN